MSYSAHSIDDYRGYTPRPKDKIAYEPADITPDRLWSKYISKRRPVVIDGLLQDQEWKGDRWTVDHLRTVAGDCTVKVEPKGQEGYFGTAAPRSDMLFREFLDLMQDPAEAGKWYLTTQYEEESSESSESSSDSETEDKASRSNGKGASPESESTYDSSTQRETPSLDPVFPNPTSALAEEFPAHPALLSGLVLQQANLWLGTTKSGESSSSGLHHDHHDNLYMLLSGRKRFLLFPPSAHSFLYPSGSVERVCSNGLIIYTPRDELPSTHPLSTFKGIRPDGLPPLEAAQWRLRACARALQEADERAAAQAGEGNVSANRRKGKAKQTPEQEAAQEAYVSAETLLLLAQLQEEQAGLSASGLEGFDPFDSDSEEEDELEEQLALQNQKFGRRLKVKEDDSEPEEDDSDDLGIDEETLSILVNAAAAGDEQAKMIVEEHLRKEKLKEGDSSDEQEEEEEAAESDSDEDEDGQQQYPPLAIAIARLLEMAGEGDETAYNTIHKAISSLQEPDQDPKLPSGKQLLKLVRGFLEDAMEGDASAAEILNATFGRILLGANFSAGEEVDEELESNEDGSSARGMDLEDDEGSIPNAMQFSSKPGSRKHRPSSGSRIDEDSTSQDGTDADDYDEDPAQLTVLQSDEPLTNGFKRGSKRAREAESSDEEYVEEEQEENSDGRHPQKRLMFFPSGDEDDSEGDEWGWDGKLEEGLEDLDGEALLAALDASAQAQASEATRPDRDAGDEGEDATNAEEDDDPDPAELWPQSFSLIHPKALHARFKVPDDPFSTSSSSSNGNGMSKKAKKRAMKKELEELRRLEEEELFPQKGCPAPLVVDLKPGQMLYLPASWWHEVTSGASAAGAPHMAFNYWMYPPTALTPSKQAAQGGGASAAAGSSESLLGTRYKPYHDAEIWEEIGRMVDEQIEKYKEEARQAREDRKVAKKLNGKKGKAKKKRKTSRGGESATPAKSSASNGSGASRGGGGGGGPQRKKHKNH